MKILSLFVGLFFFSLTSTANADCSLSLKKISIPTKVTSTSPYTVSLSFNTKGSPRLVTSNFWWNKQGPFSKAVKSEDGKIIVELRTRNPGTYKLSAQVIYRCVGLKRHETNIISENLVVVK